MGSDDQLFLPKIDFSGLSLSMAGTEKWAATRALVLPAVQEYGCFEITYDDFPPELMQDALFTIRDLFDLPSETKLKNISGKPCGGYLCGNADWAWGYESFNLQNPIESTSIDEFSTLMWGDQGNPSFRDTILAFSKHLSELEQMVRRMILEALGVEKYFDEYMESSNYTVRLAKYGKKDPANVSATSGLISHKDTNILNIVCQRDVQGLEVETRDGRWITPSLNSLTIIVGEALWAWTNGRIEPPLHRVLTTGDVDRYSSAFISQPRDGCLVRAPAELVDDEHPLQFKPFDYGDYLCFRPYSDTGINSGLKGYCGLLQPKEMDPKEII